jgi:hypothetical protein
MRCYLLAVCVNSADDRADGTMSLFKVVESIAVAPFIPNVTLPFHLHAYFAVNDTEVGRTADTRVVWVRGDGFEHTSPRTNPVDLPAARVRVRSLSITAPPEPGSYEIRMEWRWRGDEAWHREEAAWPFEITDLPLPAPETMVV